MRRGAVFAACAGVWLAGAAQLRADTIVSAELTDPTQRYAHGVFGDDTTFGSLNITLSPCAGCAAVVIRYTLPETRVFEDRVARIADLDGDGAPEVIVVETDVALGASLAVYDATGKRAATDFIGQTRRWLAPAGVGDFDGDGQVEIAYVDRPHLAQELVFVRYRAGEMAEVARVGGLTNHRFGDGAISGGVRRCGGKDSVILADGDWARVVEVVLDKGVPVLRDLGPVAGMAAALGC